MPEPIVLYYFQIKKISMKKLTTILCLLMTYTVFGQNPCSSGRFASDVFQNVTTTSDITYGSNTSSSGTGTTTLKLDFYEPTGDTMAARPLIVWIHGGSFIGGSKTDPDMVAFSQSFAKKGYVCASIDYRLGFFPFDSSNAVKAVVRAVQDTRAALRYFYKDSDSANVYRIDTNRIYVGGSSAGAITSLHLAYLNNECELSDYLSATTITQLGGLEGNSGNPGYSSRVHGVLNGCGALARYKWLETGDIPLCSVHGTNDNTVKYNRGIVNPGIPLMYLDGSRMLHERACAVGLEHSFYTFAGAPHVPYVGSQTYMDTTINFFRDFLIGQMGCPDAILQPENAPLQTAFLYATNDCNGNPVTEACSPLSVTENQNKISVQIYPNPAGSSVNIIPNIEDTYSVDVYDFTGRKLISTQNDYGITNLNIESLSAGTYLLRISSGNQSYTEKLVKF
jgi:para-nitrobenzyl esterase